MDSNYALIAHFAKISWQRKGKIEGYQTGIKECVDEDIAMAKRMLLHKRCTLKDIKKYSNLTISQLNSILKEIRKNGC